MGPGHMCGEALTCVLGGGGCVGPMWQEHTHRHTQSLVVCPLTASYSKACLWGVLGSGLGQKPQECFNGSGCNTHSTG